jgi:hypothetical protein
MRFLNTEHRCLLFPPIIALNHYDLREKLPRSTTELHGDMEEKADF